MLVFACAMAQAADGIEITRANIEAADDGYRLRAVYAFELNRGLEQAVQRGMKLYFTSEIELTRPRWWWTDDKAVFARRTVALDFDPLTRVYHITVPGSLNRDAYSLDEAMTYIRLPTLWLFAPKSALKPGETYNVTLRMYMDPEYLQKPLQVDAFNNADWRLASHKKNFTYRAE